MGFFACFSFAPRVSLPSPPPYSYFTFEADHQFGQVFAPKTFGLLSLALGLAFCPFRATSLLTCRMGSFPPFWFAATPTSPPNTNCLPLALLAPTPFNPFLFPFLPVFDFFRQQWLLGGYKLQPTPYNLVGNTLLSHQE